MVLDLTSDPNRHSKNVARGESSSVARAPSDARKFVGMKFNCCSIYTRVYVNRDGTAYEGRCPKCGKPVRLKIGEGGTNSRFFETK